MTPFPWSDVAIIAVLILLNGLFAMSELAIVSSRDYGNIHGNRPVVDVGQGSQSC